MCAHDMRQLSFSEFILPFEGKLNGRNRWVRLAELVPWQRFEKQYASLFSPGQGVPAKPFRMALAALIIRKRLNCTDDELVEQIRENPYLQFFLGLGLGSGLGSGLRVWKKRFWRGMIDDSGLIGFIHRGNESIPEPPRLLGNPSDSNLCLKFQTSKLDPLYIKKLTSEGISIHCYGNHRLTDIFFEGFEEVIADQHQVVPKRGQAFDYLIRNESSFFLPFHLIKGLTLFC